TQREKLELLVTNWRRELERLDDDELHESLRAIRKAINSKKLRKQVDALIGELRRDGAAGDAPLPKPTKRAAVPAKPDQARSADDHRNPELEAMIAANPHDGDSYLVYRDWLESRGLTEGDRLTLGPLADCDDMLGELDWY